MISKTGSGRGCAEGRNNSSGTSPLAAVFIITLFLSLCLLSPPAVRKAEGGALTGWKFCIDPGHGGSETGAVGVTGLTEKEINLDVAFKLQGLLEQQGAEVYMTRTEDVYVSITDRWTMANGWGVDRFISIHHNGHADKNVNGTETLVSPSASQEALELANSVQAELVGELGLPNRGVKECSYCGVLKNTVMPAILTEASFLTNPEEEQRLRDNSYLEREAQAILRGIHMPSSISFILPQENTVSSEGVDVDLQVLGSDTIDRVDILLQGDLLQSKYSSPYTFQVDTAGLDDGTYILQAVVWYQGGGNASITRDLIVANLARHWYFAEGTTRDGFEEWLTVLNPNLEPVDFTVTYAFGEGDGMELDYRVEAESRLSIEVNEEVGAGRDVSVLVDSPLPVMVERPMYFLYKGAWAGGHVSAGVNQPSTTWYFAEGYTGDGFEEWLCLLNPGEQAAKVKVEYMSSGGLLKEDEVVVQPWQRKTLYVNEEVGEDKEVSLRLTSDQPVVAERPMYFLYEGAWAGGHVSTGANQPSATWYFAEGYTGDGFDEWLCLFNTSPESNRVDITYQTSGGTNMTDEVVIPPLSRKTIDVNLEAGGNLQLSISVTGDSPLVAERPIYHDYHGWCQGGDVGIGVNQPSRHWYFAEGYTGDGFEDWLCLQNPTDKQLEVEVRFHLESGEVLREDVSLQPLSRTTIYANSMIPYQEGVAFSVHAPGDVIVERPLYFRYRDAWVGGHTSSGYAPGVER